MTRATRGLRPSLSAQSGGGAASLDGVSRRISHHESDNLPAGTDINNTTIVTGHDLTAGAGKKLAIAMKDVGATGRMWPESVVYVDYFHTGAPSIFLWNHSGAYMQCYLVDAATGAIRFTDHTRNAAYISSSLYQE